MRNGARATHFGIFLEQMSQGHTQADAFRETGRARLAAFSSGSGVHTIAISPERGAR